MIDLFIFLFYFIYFYCILYLDLILHIFYDVTNSLYIHYIICQFLLVCFQRALHIAVVMIHPGRRMSAINQSGGEH